MRVRLDRFINELYSQLCHDMVIVQQPSAEHNNGTAGAALRWQYALLIATSAVAMLVLCKIAFGKSLSHYRLFCQVPLLLALPGVGAVSEVDTTLRQHDHRHLMAVTRQQLRHQCPRVLFCMLLQVYLYYQITFYVLVTGSHNSACTRSLLGYDAFITYSRVDARDVETIAQRLEQEGGYHVALLHR